MSRIAPEKFALIDIGSNTIRTVIYERRGVRVRKLHSERDYTGLITYIQSHRLNDEGLAHLCDILAHMQRFCALCQCTSVTAFSTASLRGVNNLAEVVATVRQRTGLGILPLSAAEEMACDGEGLLRSGVREGYAFDLGGGSCQVFRFNPAGLTGGASLPFGCLSLGTRFVRQGVFPNREETRSARQFVRETLEGHLPEFANMAPPVLYAMGGTARAVAKVSRAMGAAETGGAGCRVSRETLRQLLREARNHEARTIALLRKIIPGRMTTLLPGILAMDAIAGHLDCDRLEITPVSVREGFLWTRLLPSTAPSTGN